MGGAHGRGLPAWLACLASLGSRVFSEVGQVSLECLWRLSVAVMDSVIKSYFRRKGFNSPHSLQPVIQVSQGRNSRQQRTEGLRLLAGSFWRAQTAKGQGLPQWLGPLYINQQSRKCPTNTSVDSPVEAVLLRSLFPATSPSDLECFPHPSQYQSRAVEPGS